MLGGGMILGFVGGGFVPRPMAGALPWYRSAFLVCCWHFLWPDYCENLPGELRAVSAATLPPIRLQHLWANPYAPHDGWGVVAG
jgi:hypothetical protein